MDGGKSIQLTVPIDPFEARRETKMTIRSDLFRRLAEAILTSPGEIQPAVRAAIEARAAALGSGTAPQQDGIPSALASYGDAVALHAYRVTDEDVRALKEQGYSEDAIFEVTLSAALGAGMERLERGLRALEGGSDAPGMP